MWVSTDDDVIALRTFVKQAVLPTPSNTQFVELCVKEGLYIGATNRCEATRSVLAIIRTYIISESNKCAREAAAH